MFSTGEIPSFSPPFPATPELDQLLVLVMLVGPLQGLSSFINGATDLARGVGQGIFGYPSCPPLPDETLTDIFLFVEQLTRDEWDQRLETELLWKSPRCRHPFMAIGA